jgi:hypothetical protein
VAGSCEHCDEPSGSGATKLVSVHILKIQVSNIDFIAS